MRTMDDKGLGDAAEDSGPGSTLYSSAEDGLRGAAPIRIAKCPTCGGDGKETCDNPDHGFIAALGCVRSSDVGRLGCPGCGHDPLHKIPNGGLCEDCGGTGNATTKRDERAIVFKQTRTTEVSGVWVVFDEINKVPLAYVDCEARATLYAATTDLLKALKLILADFSDYPASERPCRAFDVANAAISKATPL